MQHRHQVSAYGVLAVAAAVGWVHAAPAAPRIRASTLYGLQLEHNGPAEPGLVVVNPVTGNVTEIGGPRTELSGTGDLAVIDAKRKIFYYLGDTSKGTTLVGLNLADGKEVCSAVVPLREIEFVGIGQSLDIDTVNDRFVISGIQNGKNNSVMHTVLEGPLVDLAGQPKCGPFKLVAEFGLATYAPMIHGSTLDSAGQRLFVNLAPTQTTTAIGEVDLKAKKLKIVAPETAASPLYGMSWDPVHTRVVGLAPTQPLFSVVTFDPASATFEAKPVAAVGELGGNMGTVHAFDSTTRVMYAVVEKQPGIMTLAQVDVDQAVMLRAPTLSFEAGLKLLDALQILL